MVTIYEKIKQKRKLQEEIKEEVKPLLKMHDVVKAQLKMTRFNIKNVNHSKYKNKEELLENAKFKTRDRGEINPKFIKKYRRDAGATKQKLDEIKREYGGIDRAAIAERYQGRERGIEFERPNADSNRTIGENPSRFKSIRITREDLREATRILSTQEQSQENSL